MHIYLFPVCKKNKIQMENMSKKNCIHLLKNDMENANYDSFRKTVQAASYHKITGLRLKIVK